MLRSLLGINRLFHLSLLLGFIAYVTPAQAEYAYTTIDYPGARHTVLFGINAKGKVVGSAYFDDPPFAALTTISFVYDSRTQVFTPLPSVPGAIALGTGISAAGIVVGLTPDPTTGYSTSGTILKNGAYTMFSHPGSSLTQARAISNSGLVTGFAGEAPSGTDVGFIYDPAANQFIDILIPNSSFNITQGINGRGEVVGSVRFPIDGVYPGSPAGFYGFLRRGSGAITLFRVNDGQTRARGITNSGRITGFMTDPATGKTRGFVAGVAESPDFQALVIPDPELLDVPGAALTSPQGINDSGFISGSWIDDTGANHGFIAAPR